MSIYQEFLKKGYKVPQVKDFRGLIYDSAERFGRLPAFQLRDRVITYSQLKEEYVGLSTEFIARGLENRRIAVVGTNSYNWILAYLAASTVGVVVPIDKELDAKDVLDFMASAECTDIFADAKILNQIPDELNITKIAISSDKKNPWSGETIEALVADGKKRYAEGLNRIDSMDIDPEEMSILIFTSGTTGNSKGVCLSQRNICANINSTAKMVKVDPTLHSLSVLPLHHTYETTLGHLLLLSGGSCISYADGLRQVAKNINEYHPSVLIVVPLLLEFILKRAEASIRQSLPQKLLAPEGTPIVDLIKGLPAILRFIVKRKIKKSLGGKLRLLIVGAAPIKPETIEAFCYLGIATYQGYGLTECSPLVAGNNDFYMNPAAVGLPIPDVEIKIENPNDEGVGEVIVKGDNVMMGYFNDPEETERVMRGGYFHTGDLGYLDSDGFLYLTGRCKNVIVAQNGKNIYPEELEERLSESELIEEVLVLGVPDSKGGTTIKAKIFPCLDKINELFKDKTPSAEDIKSEIARVVSAINDKLPTYKKIIITEIVSEAFEKTTTKKIKRFGNNIA